MADREGVSSFLSLVCMPFHALNKDIPAQNVANVCIFQDHVNLTPGTVCGNNLIRSDENVHKICSCSETMVATHFTPKGKI